MIEADICRTLTRSKLKLSSWDSGQHFISKQTDSTDGRIVVHVRRSRGLERNFSDFLLPGTCNITRLIVEVKLQNRPVSIRIEDDVAILGSKPT